MSPHRTVSTHLYRIFPKLGITARSELGAAFAAGQAAVSSVEGIAGQDETLDQHVAKVRREREAE